MEANGPGSLISSQTFDNIGMGLRNDLNTGYNNN